MKVHQRKTPLIQFPAQVKNFTLSNVRCFEGKHLFKIHPLTVIIGENSTGKSTVLGCIQSLGDLLYLGSGELNFNCAPYSMESYENIARKQSKSGIVANHFDIGLKITVENSQVVDLRVKVAKSCNGPESVVQRITMKIQEGGIEVILKWAFEEVDSTIEEYHSEPKFSVGKTKNRFTLNMIVQTSYKNNFTLGEIMRHNFREVLEYLSESDEHEFNTYLKKIFAISGVSTQFACQNDSHYSAVESLFPPFHNFEFTSIAPVRAKPERTYNPEREDEDPEGYEVATLLVNQFRLNTKQWEKVKARLEQFGRSSGLFEEINIRPLGDLDNDPFQIMVTIRKGTKVNYRDAGYGVSQLLPILVRIFNSGDRNLTLLMQQPESHLHPRVQAEFASLLIALSKELPHTYIVETHSQFIVDRLQVEILNGGIDPKDVSLIFIRKKGDKVKTHNVSFDRQSNFIGAPVGFQNFYVEEHHALLGFQD